MAIPVIRLIGRNAKLEEGIYSDDYMDELNKFATVDEVFAEHRGNIANGLGRVLAPLVMDTLGIREYENHLVDVVMKAAKAGKWVAVERLSGRHDAGLDVVTEKQFGYVAEHQGKKFLLPSAMYVAYCKQKLQ